MNINIYPFMYLPYSPTCPCPFEKFHISVSCQCTSFLGKVYRHIFRGLSYGPHKYGKLRNGQMQKCARTGLKNVTSQDQIAETG